MSELVFEFDGPPPRHTAQSGRGVMVRGGRPMFFTRKAVAEEVDALYRNFKERLPSGWQRRTGPVAVEVELTYPARQRDRLRDGERMPHATRPDADNLVKSILDALTAAGVWKDDGQVHRLEVSKWRSRRPRWSVRVFFDSPASPAQGTLFSVP